MARPASALPTDGELAILRVLWGSGPATLGTLCAALTQERPVAKTTVATMLKVMLTKGLVRRTEGPRGYLWSAVISHQAAAASLLHKVLERLFDGSAGRLVAHLIENGKISNKDRAEILRLLAQGRDAKPPHKEPSP
jgi:predicted transcriptional regulator